VCVRARVCVCWTHLVDWAELVNISPLQHELVDSCFVVTVHPLAKSLVDGEDATVLRYNAQHVCARLVLLAAALRVCRAERACSRPRPRRRDRTLGDMHGSLRAT